MATSAELIDLIKDGLRQAAARDAASFGAAHYPTHARGVQSGYERALRIIDRIAAGQDWTGRPRPTTKET